MDNDTFENLKRLWSAIREHNKVLNSMVDKEDEMQRRIQKMEDEIAQLKRQIKQLER